MNRRDFLATPLAAAATGALDTPASAAGSYGMPGRFPGRVVSVKHSGASINLAYQAAPIRSMVTSGMMALTGQTSIAAAWRTLFQPGDKVGIKVNGLSATAATISSPTALVCVIQGLLLAGVRPMDILVFERYQDGLNKVLQAAPGNWLPGGVQTAWSTPGSYIGNQTGISGYNQNDPVYLPAYLLSWMSASNPAHTNSYLSLPFSRCTKVISLAVLKDHQAAGLTGCLKNVTIGCYNNCNRFHDLGVNDDSKNWLRYAIPALIAAQFCSGKLVLGILDGVHCLTDGGPANYSDPKFGLVTEHNTMFFGTDLVAVDTIGLQALDAERAKKGMPPEELAGADRYDIFSHRQTDHIQNVGLMYGLGEWRPSSIDLRQITLA